MSRTFHRAGASVLAVLAITGCSDTSGPLIPQPLLDVSAAATTYSGQAFALQVAVPALGINQKISDTGPLPAGGGQRSNAVVAYSIPNVLQLEILSANTSGQGNSAQSQAKVLRTKLFIGPNVILIEIIDAFSKAQCVNGQPVVSGSTVIAGITINGQRQVVTGQPNQRILLPGGGSLVINEQIVKPNSIIVRGVHVQVPRVLELAISQAYSDINC